MPRLSIHLLGPFQVSLNGEPVSGFASDKVRALLAYLVLTPDRPHRREALAGLLWPEFPERAARNSLRNALANLRQVLKDRDASPRFLLSTHQTIQFNSQSDYWLDAVAFESLITAVRPVSEGLEQAVSLAQGAFLEGFTLADAAPFEEWQLLRREGFCRRVVEALDSLTTLYEQRGAYEEALPHARRRVELEPWQEEGRALLDELAQSLSSTRRAVSGKPDVLERARHFDRLCARKAIPEALVEQMRTMREQTNPQPQHSQHQPAPVASATYGLGCDLHSSQDQ